LPLWMPFILSRYLIRGMGFAASFLQRFLSFILLGLALVLVAKVLREVAYGLLLALRLGWCWRFVLVCFLLHDLLLLLVHLSGNLIHRDRLLAPCQVTSDLLVVFPAIPYALLRVSLLHLLDQFRCVEVVVLGLQLLGIQLFVPILHSQYFLVYLQVWPGVHTLLAQLTVRPSWVDQAWWDGIWVNALKTKDFICLGFGVPHHVLSKPHQLLVKLGRHLPILVDPGVHMPLAIQSRPTIFI
jgi:hypothetical protein